MHSVQTVRKMDLHCKRFVTKRTLTKKVKTELAELVFRFIRGGNVAKHLSFLARACVCPAC